MSSCISNISHIEVLSCDDDMMMSSYTPKSWWKILTTTLRLGHRLAESRLMVMKSSSYAICLPYREYGHTKLILCFTDFFNPQKQTRVAGKKKKKMHYKPQTESQNTTKSHFSYNVLLGHVATLTSDLDH